MQEAGPDGFLAWSNAGSSPKVTCAGLQAISSPVSRMAVSITQIMIVGVI